MVFYKGKDVWCSIKARAMWCSKARTMWCSINARLCGVL